MRRAKRHRAPTNCASVDEHTIPQATPHCPQPIPHRPRAARRRHLAIPEETCSASTGKSGYLKRLDDTCSASISKSGDLTTPDDTCRASTVKGRPCRLYGERGGARGAGRVGHPSGTRLLHTGIMMDAVGSVCTVRGGRPALGRGMPAVWLLSGPARWREEVIGPLHTSWQPPHTWSSACIQLRPHAAAGVDLGQIEPSRRGSGGSSSRGAPSADRIGRTQASAMHRAAAAFSACRASAMHSDADALGRMGVNDRRRHDTKCECTWDERRRAPCAELRLHLATCGRRPRRRACIELRLQSPGGPASKCRSNRMHGRKRQTLTRRKIRMHLETRSPYGGSGGSDGQVMVLVEQDGAGAGTCRDLLSK